MGWYPAYRPRSALVGYRFILSRLLIFDVFFCPFIIVRPYDPSLYSARDR
jgi:hypothetical protein